MTEFIEDLPSLSQFKRDVGTVNSDGDMDKAYNAMKIALNGEKNVIVDNKEVPLTWSFILLRFTEHTSWWKYYYGKQQEGGWIKSANQEKRKTIEQFIEKELWSQMWVVQKGTETRNEYLFGKLPLNNLMTQLRAFRQEYQKN
jgi:hypothetical protein